MKYVLEQKDRNKSWYRGFGNMTPGELDDHWKMFLKSTATVSVFIGIMLAAYVIAIFVSGDWDENSDKVIGLCLGIGVTHVMYCFCAIDTLRQRIKLVKDEKGAIL